jgi:DNA-binding response OmpR family regulator
MTKILLIDDEELLLYSLSKTLRNSGADVTAVTNGKDGLREIQGSFYDICFLDVQLPDANGLDLMKIVRELSPSTGVIIMTGDCLNDEQQHALRSHGCHYLPKPFELDHVQALVTVISGRNTAGEA